MLTAAERERAKYHLGYPNVTIASSLFFGVPIPLQTSFLIERALSNLPVDAENRVRHISQVMDGVECRLIDAQDRLAAEQLGELRLRPTDQGLSEPDALEREYCRWGYRLADELGVPIYAYSTRYSNALQSASRVGAGRRARNITVRS
jgi:hypothetical protein